VLGPCRLLTFYPPENYTFGVELVDWPATLVPDTRSTSATFLYVDLRAQLTLCRGAFASPLAGKGGEYEGADPPFA
jgi:hypothetical protein